jgi:hypothetical protein
LSQRRGLQLDRVVLLGRTLDEYTRFFGLNLNESRGRKILDVAGGVSSFTAEARALGLDATAFDRIYSFSAEEIENKCAHDLAEVTTSIADRPVYRWDFYKSPAGMRAFRERAYKAFLADFRANPGHYISGALPQTPFADRQFDLTLVSYLLLVYEDQLTYEFHRDSLRELMRVTNGEIRIYPIVTFEAEKSKYLDRLKTEFTPWRFDIVKTDFEFLQGSNFYLRVFRS